ncbi:hypothetical protein U1Q18_018201 [Sarracenia purpurea var. burkii]
MAKPLSPLPLGLDYHPLAPDQGKESLQPNGGETESTCFADNPLAAGDPFADLAVRRGPSCNSDLDVSVDKDESWDEKEEKEGLWSRPFRPCVSIQALDGRRTRSVDANKPDLWSPTNPVRRGATRRSPKKLGAKNPSSHISAILGEPTRYVLQPGILYSSARSEELNPTTWERKPGNLDHPG